MFEELEIDLASIERELNRKEKPRSCGYPPCVKGISCKSSKGDCIFAMMMDQR